MLSLILILLTPAIIFFYYLLKGHREWKKTLKSNPFDRQLKSKSDFVRFFTKKGYSEKSVEFVYINTQVFLKAKDIVLLPEDNLIELYERQEDEWLHEIRKWFKKLNKPFPDNASRDEFLLTLKQINFEYLIQIVDR